MLKQKLNKKKQALYSAFLVAILAIIGILIFQNFFSSDSKSEEISAEDISEEETAVKTELKEETKLISESFFQDFKDFIGDKKTKSLEEIEIEEKIFKVGRKNPFEEI